MQPSITNLRKKNFEGFQQNNETICTLELTVTTGFEEVAAQECREKLKIEPVTLLGRIVFDISVNNVPKVLKLRSVENVNVLIGVEQEFSFTMNREECFENMYKFVNAPDWRKGIRVWQLVFGEDDSDFFSGEQELKDSFCTPKPEVDLKRMKNDSSISGNLPQDILKALLKKQEETDLGKKSEKELEKSELKEESNLCKSVNTEQRIGKGPKFRVTCHRVGNSHIFGSSEAARQFGGGINEKFGWPVDLKHYSLEVLLNIIENFVYVGLSLTREPLFKRNIAHFGPTTLRSTICYNMIKLAKPQPGDFVIDPMCGGSSIPIEGALTHNQCFYLGGDNVEVATTRSRMNIDNLIQKKKSLAIDAIRWDSTSLPFRSQVVDAIVCDLPFGKRIGSKVDNRVLYLKSLVELARVTRLNTGRAVLLTYDKKSMAKSLLRVSSLWKNFSTRSINIGGLIGGIYLLQRTGVFSDPTVFDSYESQSQGKKRKLSSDKAEQE